MASTAASVATAAVLGSMVRGGGLKLARSIQKSADNGGALSTRAVESITKLRKALDELEGINRYVDNTVDPYSKLVFEDAEGKLTTGTRTSMINRDMVLEGGTWIPRSDIQQAGMGVTREPASVWTFKDDIQQKLVKQARRLPYELPALYVAQRAVTDPLFGNKDDRRKVKWYNPVDVLADFAKQSTINIAAVTLPAAGGGAVFSRAKFYANAPYASNPNLSLTANQLRASNMMADAKVVLEELGQDIGKLGNQISRISSSAAGAFEFAVEEAAKNQGSPVFAMQQARRGMQKAGEALANKSGVTRRAKATQQAKALFLGTEAGGERYQGLLDTLPGMRGFTSGFSNFGNNFRIMKKGYDVVSGAVSFDEALNAKVRGSTPMSSEMLQKAMNKVQSQHKSKFSSFAESMGTYMGAGGPADGPSDVGGFARVLRENEYRKQLRIYLTNNNVDEEVAQNFSSTIRISQVPTTSSKSMHVSNRISLGKSQIISDTDDDFYNQLAERFRKNVGAEKAPSADALRRSIQETDQFLTRKEFEASFQQKVKQQWNAFYSQQAVPYGNTIMRPQKAVYQDFVGPLTAAKEDFLRRRTAQVLGIKLADQQGRQISSKIVNNELRRRGFDTDNFGQLRGFLINNKAMTSQSSSGGYNLFGMKQLLVDEAFEKGIFNHMPADQRDIVRNLAGRIKASDPVSKSIGFSKLDGVYQNRNGEIVDYTRIRSMVTGLGRFFANEFQIPIVKFNPLQMLGVGGPTGVNANAPFQIVAGQSVQPFGGIKTNAADVYIWTKKKGGIFGPKGALSYVGADETGGYSVKELRGSFRQMNVSENNLFTRAASFAANRGSMIRTAEMEAAAAGKQLSFTERMKAAFNVDEDQPNSLFRLGGRFAKRKTDINNPSVFGRLLEGDEVSIGRKSGRKISLQTSADGKYSVIDDAGEELYGHSDVLKAYDSFRRTTMEYATPLRVIAEMEERLGLGVPVGGRIRKISDITSEAEMKEAAISIGAMLEEDKALLSASGVKTRGLTRAYSRVSKFIEDSNLNAVSQMAAKSPAVSTRLDEFRNEIYRYMVERHSYMTAKRRSICTT
jgi:hypothetical protein